jgi:hypothetical protein
MAKKVRRSPDEEAAASFELPSFDEAKFFTKEFELGGALGFTALFALIAGALSWVGTSLGVWWWAIFLLGFADVFSSYWVLRRIRPKAELYTKGDWAGLLAIQFFGWIALWFVLVNVV